MNNRKFTVIELNKPEPPTMILHCKFHDYVR